MTRGNATLNSRPPSLALLIVLLPTVARGDVPNVVQMDIWLPGPPTQELAGEGRALEAHGFEPGAKGPNLDSVVVSDDGQLRVECSVRRKVANMTIRFQTDLYPERLPEEVTCTVGRNEIIARVRQLPTQAEVQQVDPVQGVEARHTVVEEGASFSSDRTFGLPDSLQLGESKVHGQQEGTKWGDLTCRVVLDGPLGPAVQVSYSHKTSDGKGVCPLPLTYGGEWDMPVRVLAAEVDLEP